MKDKILTSLKKRAARNDKTAKARIIYFEKTNKFRK